MEGVAREPCAEAERGRAFLLRQSQAPGGGAGGEAVPNAGEK